MDGPPRYPVMLDLAGRACLVVGGGAVAARKVDGLSEAGAVITVVAPALSPVLTEMVSAGVVRWRELALDPADPLPDGDWALVVAATDDADLNHAIAQTCDRSGLWAIDVSSPTGGTVSTPAVHRQGPITVAVSTSGTSPSAAGWLRDELASAIDPAIVVMLELLAEIQAGQPPSDDPAGSTGTGVRADAVSGHTGPRSGRPDWKRLLDSGTLDDIRHGRVARAKERLQACLSSSSD